jgi:hypothetical protein
VLDHSRCIRSRLWRAVRHDLGSESSADVLHAAVLPGGEAGCAQRVEDVVVFADAEVLDLGSGGGGDDIQLEGNLSAVGVKRQIVYVVAEGVLDFASDGGESEDNVGSDYNLLDRVL